MTVESSGSFGTRFREGRQRLADAQKPADGVPAYLRWVNRRAGRFFAACAYGLKTTPNVVTLVSAAVSFAGLVVLVAAPVAVWTGVVVAVLLALGFALDSADGQLARLYRMSSATGEWLDHVADAFRAPMFHAAVALALVLKTDGKTWLVAVALVWCVVTAGQFLSQILAESMVRRAGRAQTRGGVLRSFVLLPTDTGVQCWMFVLWGVPVLFAVVYTALAVIAVVHSAVSLRRRFRDLTALDRARRENDHA